MTPDRFSISTNAAGVTSIVDSTRQSKHNVVALFFRDADHPKRVELYAKVCADALNAEAQRRSKA